MAGRQPASVEIRSYQVGFGDCFLLSFVYADGDRRHVLVDFGTTKLPHGLKPSEYMPLVAADVAKVCADGSLVAVVATHRHADHVSGFATDGATGGSGTVIAQLAPKVVIQPWTEDPEAATDATAATVDSRRNRKSFVGSLRAMHAVARVVAELAESKPAWMSASLQGQLSFLGMDNIANESAVQNLIAMGRAKGATAVFAHHGSTSGLSRRLPGVKVRVLGPPNLQQSEKIRKMRSTDADEFWHLLSGPASLHDAAPLADGMKGAVGRGGGARLPFASRWFRDRLERLRGDQLLQIVRTLDDQMNNTSLILLFEVFGRKLLFPGDAQLENWSYALQDAPDAAATRALLAGVDVYKVGHHGSLNATPKMLLWAGFTKRGPAGGGRMRSVLSTLPGKHGTVANNTEVPRKTLLAALEGETELFDTEKLPANKLCNLVTVTP